MCPFKEEENLIEEEEEDMGAHGEDSEDQHNKS